MTKLTFPALRSSALAGAAALALAGCSLAPTYERPAAPVPQTIQGAASMPSSVTSANTRVSRPAT